MVGLCTGQPGRAFYRIEPVHFAESGFLTLVTTDNASTINEIARVSQTSRQSRQEIGIERQNHIGLIEVVNGVDCATKCELCTSPYVISSHRFVLKPLGFRQVFA